MCEGGVSVWPYSVGIVVYALNLWVLRAGLLRCGIFDLVGFLPLRTHSLRAVGWGTIDL